MFVKKDESEYVEDSPLGVVNWLEDEVDSMRHPRLTGGPFWTGSSLLMSRCYRC